VVIGSSAPCNCTREFPIIYSTSKELEINFYKCITVDLLICLRLTFLLPSTILIAEVALSRSNEIVAFLEGIFSHVGCTTNILCFYNKKPLSYVNSLPLNPSLLQVPSLF